MQVSRKERPDHVFIVTFPYRLARSCLDRLCSDCPRHPPLRDMKIFKSFPRQQLAKISLAEFGAIHADRGVSDIEQQPYARVSQSCDQILGRATLVADGKKIRPLHGTRLIPQRLVFGADAGGSARKFEWAKHQG